MEEHALSSMLSDGKTNIETVETSNSFCSYYHPYHTNKCLRPKHNNNAAKFKGVVLQQKGHWGAQIYANHQRIWLGTFKTQKEAAIAYDSAAIKLRSGDSHRNFPWTEENIQELDFQHEYSPQAILNMIRDGSYQTKFVDFLRIQSTNKEVDTGLKNQTKLYGGHGKFSCIHLFQKELTPSDVGKLNRLVIPKKFAIKYFPYICGNVEQDGARIDDLEIVFFDKLMKCWKFRYCYWRSSQSFVFTRGWNRFVKEKNLKEKDIVTFYACMCPERVQGQQFSLIDISYNNGKSCVAQDMQKELEINLGQTMRNKSHKVEGKKLEEKNELKGFESNNSTNENGLRLFGVRIN